MLTNGTFNAAAVAAFLALTMPFTALAAVEQVADIYPEPGAVEGSLHYKVHQGRDGLWFFSADTAADGIELWSTDGTAGGTHRLTDTPGANDTDPEPGVFIGEEFYFVVDSDDTGDALWKSDGTVTGTELVFEAVPGPGGDDDIAALTSIDGALYFDVIVNDDFALWTSDGTQAGTRKIASIGTDSAPSVDECHISSVNGRIIFTADDGTNGVELWITDGTAAGTSMLKDINPGAAGSSPSYFAPLNDTQTLFNANGGLWATDGTVSGTQLIASGSDPVGLTAAGGRVYFLASSTSDGERLWQTDGSSASLVDFSGTSYANAGVYILSAGGPDVYFTIKNGGYIGRVLLKANGTAASLVYDAGTDDIAFFAYGGGKLYFNTLGSSNKLFVYDGTTAPTPIENLTPAYLTVSGDKLFMWADDGTHGDEPWVSDGTAAGTRMIENLAGADAGSEPDQFTVANGRLVFSAGEPVHGYEPRISDGTTAGTRLLADIRPGSDDSDPEALTAAGGTVYFAAEDDAHGDELWKVTQDGGAALVKDIEPGSDGSDPYHLDAFNGALYFTAYTSASGVELWKSDGTEAGTAMVADLAPGTDGSFPHHLTAVGDKLFFAADDPGSGDQQLWVSDGTSAGTKEITGGTFDDFYEFTSMDGVLYFVVDGSAHSYDIWRSDGTAAGTTVVANVVTGVSGGPPPSLTAYDGGLYFASWTAASGMELWRTDGTAGGTKLFADIFPDAPSSWPSGFTAVGGKLYFGAYGPDGRELWMTDGVKTVEVKDINPGVASSGVDHLAAVGNRVVFAASDGINGYEPWISDGTALGTRMIGDVSSGAGNSNPYEFVLLKRQLFFAAADGTTGAELWRADINRAPAAVGASVTTAFETACSGTLTASDPDGDPLTFSITKQPAHGTLKLADAAFTYTPADGYSGEDNFTFKADDGLAASTATLKITVQSAGDDAVPPDNGGDAPPPSDNGGGSGGGGAFGWLGLCLLGGLAMRRKQRG